MTASGQAVKLILRLTILGAVSAFAPACYLQSLEKLLTEELKWL